MRPLAYAAAVARWYKSRLTVLHVVPTFDPMQVRSGSLGDPVRIVQPMPREQVLEELRVALNATHTATLDVTLAAEAGDSVKTIVDQAVTMPADLLFIFRGLGFAVRSSWLDRARSVDSTDILSRKEATVMRPFS